MLNITLISDLILSINLVLEAINVTSEMYRHVDCLSFRSTTERKGSVGLTTKERNKKRRYFPAKTVYPISIIYEIRRQPRHTPSDRRTTLNVLWWTHIFLYRRALDSYCIDRMVSQRTVTVTCFSLMISNTHEIRNKPQNTDSFTWSFFFFIVYCRIVYCIDFI